ncbi:flavodoxin-dependent (E)-4-hydroxy-3-methylbut-2-enyl-diphosphate synthase [Nocardia sp. NPDC004860]|uniref:flavodoxin-dependent (E)-4-hydroxy-3-methylbut-2-enyl-diphosphate synthase n=1 Tax=Nocardia sp. NPDC004860 TaxID=3154557 RepID=UPI0033B6CB07
MITTRLDLAAAPPVRRRTRRIRIGRVPVGGGAPIPVQTMTTTPTRDVDATLRQTAEVTAAGKGQIFVRGRVVRTVAEHQIVEALLAEAVALTENAGSEDTL